MPCYRPLTAWKPDEGPLVFHEKKNCRELQIACGQCIGCRIIKREAWAIRCYAESKMFRNNHFVTLTYADDKLPQFSSLTYRDWQLFAKRLRKRLGPFRFFMCGEYGETTFRPHYHALLFGLDIPDLVKSNSVYSSFDLFESETIAELWGKGQCTIGEVTYESARYCAVYTTKKVSGERWLDEPESRHVDEFTGEINVRLQPFAHMSLKPGIGFTWLQKYWKDLFVSGANGVVINGMVRNIPKYFVEKMDEIAPVLMDDWEYDRYLKVNQENNSRARLEVREECAKAKESFNRERKDNYHAV